MGNDLMFLKVYDGKFQTNLAELTFCFTIQ